MKHKSFMKFLNKGIGESDPQFYSDSKVLYDNKF